MIVRISPGRVILLMLFFIAEAAGQDKIVFPPAPTTAIDAEAAFDARAAAVIRFNACGREIEYADLRAKMKASGAGEGEDLTSILIAKIAWLNNSTTALQDCHWAIRIPRPRNQDGSWEHATSEEFAKAKIEPWLNPETGCAMETSPTQVTETEIRVNLNVTAACMRTEVNEAIVAMVKNAQMGTSGLVCAEHFNFSGHDGEWDVNVRELVRILYMGSRGRMPVLDASTVDYMYRKLLAARGKVGPSSYSQLADCSSPAGDELGTPEDTADRHSWTNDFFEDLGGIFHWLIQFYFKLVGTIASYETGLLGAPFLILTGHDPLAFLTPHWDIRVEETENHRLMIESSRFLTNADIIRRLKEENYDHVDDVQADQDTVRDWLLNRLSDIATNDFIEYNSRPYTRYSLNSIVNLYDFAEFDEEIHKAAQCVLDLSEAKFAAGSNRGRRIGPFRRRPEYDGSGGEPQSNLFNNSKGADHEIARAIVLAGQTQLLPNGIEKAGMGDLVNAATSSYRLPKPVLQAAVERGRIREQRVRHASIEYYYQSPAFTITAGGLSSAATASLFGFEHTDDRGAAMPTFLIPTIAATNMNDLYGFLGVGVKEKRSSNLCVWKTFFCGLQPQFGEPRLTPPLILPLLRDCLFPGTAGPAGALFFVNSAACVDSPGPHFYLAIRRGDCDGTFCDQPHQWGIMEAVEAPNAKKTADAEFEQWKTSRTVALEASLPGADGRGIYQTAAGEKIHYLIRESKGLNPFHGPDDPQFPSILEVNDQPIPQWKTSGGTFTSEGGKATICSPSSGAPICGPMTGGPKVLIDVTDPSNPKRDP